MLLRPDMAVIGATARQVGKTTFACEVICRQSGRSAVVAIKITTVQDHEGSCPRGGSGCGACAGFTGPYCITEENAGPPGKDTTRLLAAGAARVFWLRVRRDHLAEGLAELLRRIPPGVAIVCESNSVRHVVEPGVFLVIAAPKGTEVKPSCAEVMPLADRVIRSDGRGWDRPASDLTFAAGRWLLRQTATAIILAGGQSRRMGTDKSLLPLDGQPLIQHIARQLEPLFDQVLIGANRPEKYAFMQLPVVPDEEPDQGPLMGILSCVSASAHELNFVTACDIPHLDLGFVLELLKASDGYDIVMPVSANGRHEPLFAVYRKTMLPLARRVLRRGGRRITELFESAQVRFVDLPAADWYRNLNTPEDYRRAIEPAAEPSGRTCGDVC
jgi:molybdenum cofactor guanylyltransferase